MSKVNLYLPDSTQKGTIKKQLEVYLQELACWSNGKEASHPICYPYFDLYWTEVGRIPILILKDKLIIGFALINTYTLDSIWQADRSMAEFYIQFPYRGKGWGREAAHMLFRRYSGKWEVAVWEGNSAALYFWRSTIDQFTQGKFQEKEMNPSGQRSRLFLFQSK